MNIALIYDQLKFQNDTAMLLDDAGFTVSLTFSTESPWFAAIVKDTPDVIVISVSVPSDNLLQQLNNFKEQAICPVIVLANDGEVEVIEKVILAGADSCVTGDVSAERLQSLVQINLARFKVTKGRLKQIHELNKNIESLESRLSDRKDIERAKGLLMKTYSMNENDAYNAMRSMAMDTGNKLGEVARNLISMSKVLN